MAQKRREKAAREHRDVQQIDVAAAAGVSKTSVSRYERDIDVPRESVLAKIAAFLDTTPRELRYGPEPGAVTSAPAEPRVRDVGAARAANQAKRNAKAKRAVGDRPGPTRRPKPR